MSDGGPPTTPAPQPPPVTPPAPPVQLPVPHAQHSILPTQQFKPDPMP